jgi:hypothetical protein
MRNYTVGPFTLEQRRRQRKIGGCKNTYVIYVSTWTIIQSQLTEKDHSEILSYLNKQAETRKGNGWLFAKREQAEKAWVYLTLKWC